MAKEKGNKKHKENRIFKVILTYLIPIINIIVVLSNYSEVSKSIIIICNVLASTAAASACTIKGIKEDSKNKLNTAQVFALVFSVVAFMCCLIYDVDNKLYLPIWIVGLLTVIANVITIYMFVVVDNELDELLDDNESKKQIKSKADRASRNRDGKINLTKKGGN